MRHLLMFLALVLLALNPIRAQDDAPLLAVLALIPDTAQTRTEITYNDRAAITEAYPAAIPPSLAAARNPNPNTRNPFTRRQNTRQAVWWAVYSTTTTSPSVPFINFDADTQRLVGFSLFDIQQEAQYGAAPANATLFVLGYDAGAVQDALAARGFAAAPDVADGLWCGPGGCANGAEPNLREREPGDPFGGQLGRKQPLVLGDGYLLSSPSLEQVEAHLAAAADPSTSLRANPRYALLAETAASYGPVIQALFLDGEPLASVRDTADLAQLLPLLDADERAAYVERRLAQLDALPGDLPPYNLLLLADTATDDAQVVLVLLSYDTVAAAEAAAEVVPARVAAHYSLARQGPLAEELDALYVEAVTAEVVPGDGERAALVLRFTAPKAPNAEALLDLALNGPTDTQPYPPPGAVFRLLVAGVFARDVGWLSAVPLAEERALLAELAAGP